MSLLLRNGSAMGGKQKEKKETIIQVWSGRKKMKQFRDCIPVDERDYNKQTKKVDIFTDGNLLSDLLLL